MNRSDRQQLLMQELTNFSRKLRAHFDSLVREKGLTLPRVRLLYNLVEADGQTQRDLAAALEIETPTLVRLLDSMEEQGLIERRALETDRRAKQIFMTEAGRAVAAEMAVFAGQFRDRLMQGLSDDELDAGRDVVRHLLERLVELDALEAGRGVDHE